MNSKIIIVKLLYTLYGDMSYAIKRIEESYKKGIKRYYYLNNVDKEEIEEKFEEYREQDVTVAFILYTPKGEKIKLKKSI